MLRCYEIIGMIMKGRFESSLRVSFFVFLCSQVLSSCGGGITGSGNGGGSPGPANSVLVGYQIAHIPPSFAASLPESLLTFSDESGDLAGQPVASVVGDFQEISPIYVNLGLVQLYTDVLWKQIEAYCKDSDEGVDCHLSGAGLSFTYTRDMAIRESYLRWNYTLGDRAERSWETGQITLNEEAAVKINTTIEISIASYKKSPTAEFDHEVHMTLPGQEALASYHLLWNNERSLVQTTAIDAGGESTVAFNSIYHPAFEMSEERQHVIMGSNSSDIQDEFQFNLYRDTDEAKTYLESLSTRVEPTGRTNILSRGHVDDVGGYVFSETNFEDPNSITTESLHRESFGLEAGQYSYARCGVSPDIAGQCDSQTDWSLIYGEEPTRSAYYQPESVLDTNLRPIEVRIENVTDSVDSFILIRRDNLIISLTNEGLQVSIPGLGSFSWPLTEEDIAGFQNNDNLLGTTGLHKDVLCRVIPARDDSVSTFRTFCVGSVEDIENALVVSTSYVDGVVNIAWQANANVVVTLNE